MNILTISRYVRNTKNSKWILKEEEIEENYTFEKFQKIVVEAAPFFESLGGYEKNYGTIQVSISPDRLKKSVYEWK